MPTNTSTIQTPLTELRSALSQFADRCRAARWFGALFRVGILQDIEKDVEVQAEKIAREAYSAEQLDLEAIKAIDAGNLPLARRLVLKSAQRDRNIEEASRA